MAGGRADPRAGQRPRRLDGDGDDGEPEAIPELPVDAHPELFRARTHGIVDFCEDVSSKDIISAVREGYDSIELAKRYTTATMGPTQGKIELVNAIAAAAEATGRSIADTGYDDLAAALCPGDARGAGGAATRARSVLTDAAVARGAPRPPADRRGLDQARSLR